MDVFVLALFPEITHSFRTASIVGRAAEQGLVRFHDVQLRDFSVNKHRTVDDTPYGGGSGMVMMCPPVVGAIESLPATFGAPARRPRVVMLTPQGQPFTQATARRLAQEPALAFVCGRYEGFDERIRAYVDEELSLGDFVLTGGEAAAVPVIDAIVRLLPGVLGNAESAASESHSEGTLEYPQYTRPADFRGVGVPAVLSGGDHGRVAKWRRWQALRRTRERRPDLFDKLELSAKERAALDGDEP